MKPITLGLSGLLAVQLTVAAGLYWHQNHNDAEHTQAQPLLSFSQPAIDRVVISDGQRSVTLAKQGQEWQLPDMDGLPVNTTRLSNLIDKLAGLTGQWSVATTTASHKRFAVDAALYQRRVQLFQGDTLASELYLGSSPGFRKSHIRASDNHAIYALELNAYELPTDGNDWLDRRLLAASDLQQISGPDYAIQKAEGGWRFLARNETIEPAAPVELDATKADQLANALANLQVQSVVSESVASSSDDKGITLQVAGRDSRWTYRFQQQGDRYLVRRDDRDQAFSISKYDYERIAQIGLPQLAVESTPPKATPSQPTEPDGTSSNS